MFGEHAALTAVLIGGPALASVHLLLPLAFGIRPYVPPASSVSVSACG